MKLFSPIFSNLTQINRKYRLLIWLPTLAILMSGGYGFKHSGYLSPGPTSSAHPKNQPLQGYVSHADFQMECGHCHAPIHCVTDDRCQDCHMDIARQRAEADGLHSLLPGTDKCQTCHTEHLGTDESISHVAFKNIDHMKLAGFSLKKHTKNYDGSDMNCESCHAQGRYASETLDCLTCHMQADHDGMAARVEKFGSACLDCHDGVDRMDNFDHNDIFALDGGHADLDCAECHADYQFLQTTSDCKSCHEEPELHAGLFGLDCARCHTNDAWAPAQLMQHTFLLDHGLAVGEVSTCESCHVGSYVEYTCASCHTDDEMIAAHAGQVIENLNDCISCHPTGVNVNDEIDATGTKDG